MCTVTFLPTKSGILFTSSRDENYRRAAALAPAMYQMYGKKLVYPKDQQAAGTWIGMQETGKFAVLLNGAFKKHQPEAKYHKSRGQVFLDIMAASCMNRAFGEIILENIEPFTILLLENGRLTENRWDGVQKYILEMPVDEARIWSSVTLYEPAVIKERCQWFQEWRARHPDPTVEQIVEFHLQAGNGDEGNQIRMNRNGKMLTVSITCMDIREQKATMHYLDLAGHTRYKTGINYSKAPAPHP